MSAPDTAPRDRYRIERVLGEGGMAVVYEVTDRLTDRRLALKRIRPERMTPTVRGAMVREFSVLTRLRHPNLVEVYDFYTEPTCTFTMEVIDGQDLREADLRGDELIEAVVQICRVLEYVHARGLVHLDIKPSNILVVRNGDRIDVKLMDFGVASSQREAAPSGYTLGFVAPEIVEGRGLDGRADLYSLGMSLLALRDRNRLALSEVTVKVRPLGRPPLSPLLPIETAHLPQSLKTIVERLVRIDPSERFGSAAQVIAAIAAASGRPIPFETPATRVGWVGSPRLAGRDAELALLEARWAEVKAGAARHVTIEGAPGLGKSRLVGELRVQVQLGGGLVATVAAVPGAPAYATVAKLVAQLRRVIGGERGLEDRQLAELARLRSGPGGGESAFDLGSSAARSRLSEAVLALVAQVARARPLLIAIEDIQWLDAPSAALFELLAQRVAGGEIAGLMLVTTARLVATPATGERLTLAPLAAEDVRTIVEDAVGRGVVADTFFARSATLSGGNGFFITELMKLLVDRELLARRGDGWACDGAALAAARLPATAGDIVAERIGLLPPSLRRLLWLVALLGGTVDPVILDEAHGDGARRDLADLAGRQLLAADGRSFRFAHAEIADGALRDVGRSGEASAVALVLAVTLERRGSHPAHVARLFIEGGEPARALPHLLRAGARAEAVYDHAGAVGAYDRAVAMAARGHDVDVADLHRRRLRAIRLGGLGQTDVRAAEALAAAAGVGASVAGIRIELARVAVQRGRYADALGQAEAALELAVAAGAALARARAEATWVAGLARYHDGDLAGAIDRLEEAARAYDALGDVAGHAAALNDRGLVNGYRGDFAAALADHQRALELLEATPELPGSQDALAATLNNLGFASWNLGRYAEARAELGRALTLRQRLSDRHGEGVTRNNIGNVLRHQGDLEGAAAEYRLAIELCRRSGNVLYEAIALNNLGQIEEEEGRPLGAVELYEQALRGARAVGDKIREGDNLGSLGICHLHLGDAARAAQLLAQSVAHRRALGDRAYLVLDLSFLAVAELARGEPRSAVAAIEEALAGLASGQEGIEQVQAVHLNAHDVFVALGEADRARASLEQAVAIVTARLATLPDAESRRAFVERIRTNRVIAERAERAGIA